MRDLIIVGAGGFGRETIDVVRALNVLQPIWRLVGVADDAPSPVNIARLTALNVAYLGGIDHIPRGMHIAVSVGNPRIRADIAHQLQERSPRYPSLVHPTVTVGSEFRHGHGLIALAGISIGTNVTVGNHAHLNAHAVIGHDTVVADFVSVNPSAIISGNVSIGSLSLIGAGSTLLQGVNIASGATIGASACVTRNVASQTIVKGIPAK